MQQISAMIQLQTCYGFRPSEVHWTDRNTCVVVAHGSQQHATGLMIVSGRYRIEVSK